jgi:hypothetical protein
MSEEKRNDVNEDVIEVNGAPTEKAESEKESPVNAEPVVEEQSNVTEKPVMQDEPRQEHVAEPAIKAESQRENDASNEDVYNKKKSQYNDGSSGRSIAALILGICAICFSFTLMMGIAGLACGIIGLVLSIKERKKRPGSFATAAFIVCLIGLISGAISTVACVACMGWAAYMSFFNEPETMQLFDSMNI